MAYISASEASEKWGVSLRQVQRLLAGNRIPRAKKYGRQWMIPSDAEKPDDLRREKKQSDKALSAQLLEIIEATTIPMPDHNPDAILDALNGDRQSLQYEGELAYLRGDFERTLRCYQRTDGDDAARLRASPVAIAAAISLGDYQAYTEIEYFLKNCLKAGGGNGVAVFAELSLATATVSVFAPKMVPDWLKNGDFRALPVGARPDALYKRAKYFLGMHNLEAALTVAQTALALISPEHGITFSELYLKVTCAVACHFLERDGEARDWLLDAMRTALPNGFVTPFAEAAPSMGGLVEHCLEREFPDNYAVVIAQWKKTWKNWITFHNQFTKDNITLILSLREYHIALLAARRLPYAKIAELNHISVGRLKNIMMEIYEKLSISGRDELSNYVF